MANRSPRAKSSASTTTAVSAAARPISQHSSNSTQSNLTQPTRIQQPDPSYNPANHFPSAQWQQYQEGLAHPSLALDQSEAARFALDPSMHHHAPVNFQTDPSFQGPPMNLADQFDEGDSKVSLDIDMDANMPGENTGKRKKGSASSQANDNELRRLFRENQGRDLHEVAQQVLRDEKGPKSEKSKQVFGMLWLNANTKRATTSVPRNRVFAAYATRCGTERVPPLNPASFGKLVRIIFPGISTRRLGVRGESKYHYVELALIGDTGNDRASVPRARSLTVETNGRDSVRPPGLTSRPSFGADAAFFSPVDSPRPKTQQGKDGCNGGSLYLQIANCNEQAAEAVDTTMVQRPLFFQSNPIMPAQGDVQLELPSIEPYLPPNADVDAVNSLTSVYRSHCLLAIDNFRFCKTEKLSDSYKSLVGLLTVPGQKLLSHPQIAGWIRACDWLKYQKMIPMLDAIILTQVPKKAMAHMEYVAMNICQWISQFFQNQPRSMQDAMLEPANMFSSLLERFLRVNRAALDVSEVLENAEARTQLWNDWVKHLRPYHVLQNSLQMQGHRRCLHILTQEVRFLLTPLRKDAASPAAGVFQDKGSESEFQKTEEQLEKNGSGTSIIGRLARFLGSLSRRFPGVDARSLLNYFDVIGSNISRNLTLNGASSLGNWWRIKLFLDEMAYWLAEKGGFLEAGPNAMGSHGLWPADVDMNTLDDAFLDARNRIPLQPSMGQPPQASFDVGRHGSAPQTTGENHPTGEQEMLGINDDSGIGLGPDDDFGMDPKYNSFVHGVNGSDPADVVVC